jgi:hypothetical protein
MEVKLLLLDACRDNPLGRSWMRSLRQGLAVMDTPKGALIAYATSPGKTASDGTGRNSPFTVQLLRELDVHFVNTLPVPAALRHSRESGNPEDERYGDWMPACAGMTFSWRRTCETDIQVARGVTLK